MQPAPTKQYPPLPPKNLNFMHNGSLSRISVRQSSAAQSSSNLLALNQTNSQNMESSESSYMQQMPPNQIYNQPQQYQGFMHPSPSTPNLVNQPPSNPNYIHQSPSNSNLSRETSNSNFMQQAQYQGFMHESPSTPSSMHQSPSNPNFINQSPSCSNLNQLQQTSNSGVPQLPTNPNYPQQQSTQQYQNTNVQNQPKQQDAGQTFPVIYNGSTFMVDPIGLGKASLRFRQLIQPIILNTQQMSQVHLEVRGNKFTNRNMNNFLRLCQKLPTDVQNSEMEEICEIAKMFQADQIYTVGLNFIHNNLNKSFQIPDSKYDGSDGTTYLTLQKNSSNDGNDVADSYFEDANDKGYQGNYYKINNANDKNGGDQYSSDYSDVAENEAKNEVKNEVKNEKEEQPHNLDDHSMLHDPFYRLNKDVREPNPNTSNTTGRENAETEQKPKINEDEENKQKINEDEENKQLDDMDSVIYMVRVENHTIKCPLFKFVKDNQILYSAKQKYNDVYIAEGGDIHISKKANHVAHIYQDNVNNFNSINMQNVHFELKYVNSGRPNHYSMQVSFPYKDKVVNWVPKPPKYDPKTEKYYLNFKGEYHHTPINSSKNIILQNRSGNPTFIVRKMHPNVFEIECLPVIDPLIVFAIGLSDIIGPYDDGFSGVDYFL